MFAPAGQTTARAGLRSKLAALVVRRQAPPNPRRGERQLCRGGIYAARCLPWQPVNGKGGGLPPSLAPLVRKFSQQSVGAGHARPATLRQNPFNGSLRRGGIHPSRAPSAVANRKSPSGHRCRSATSPVRGGFSRGLRPRKKAPRYAGSWPSLRGLRGFDGLCVTAPSKLRKSPSPFSTKFPVPVRAAPRQIPQR